MKARFLLIPLILTAALAWLGLPASATPRHEPAAPAGGRWELIYEEHGLDICLPAERSLVVDGAGGLHAVYGGTGLYHARRAGNAWRHEVIDPALTAGSGASVAVDLMNGLHVCYLAGEPAELRYAWRDAAGWHSETVTTSVDAGRPCSIATGIGNAVGVAYRGPTGEVRYGYRDATTWHIEVAAAGLQPDTLSLLIDGVSPVVAVSGGGLYYLYRDEAGWHQEQVADIAYSASLAAGGGTFRIAYTKDEQVALATRSGKAWQSEIVATGQGIFEASLAVDAGGSPHIAYYEGRPEAHLMYASRGPDGWRTSPMGGTVAGVNESHVTLALAGETPVLAECRECSEYPRRENARVEVTLLQPGGAITQTVAAAYSIGETQKLGVEGSGAVHLVYSDSRSAEPVYLRQDDSAWMRESVAGASITDALALDAHGAPHIAFANEQGLHYGVRDGSAWHFEVVASPPARSPSLVLDEDQPHLAWAEDAGLYIANKTGDQWSRQLAHSGQVRTPTIALDASGAPHVSYNDPLHFRYAYRHGGRWYRAYPAPLHSVSGQTSLVLDARDVAYLGHIATCNVPGGDEYRQPQVAVRTGQEWRIEDLYPCSYLSSPLALAVDWTGGPHAAFATFYPYELHYARRLAGKWQVETVQGSAEDQPPQILAVSLALDAAGRPTISYYNPDTLGLAVVRWVETPATPTPSPTPTFTPRPTQTPSLTCLTPTPAAPYTGNPPASGTIQKQVVHCADDTYVRVDTDEILYDFSYVRMGARNGGAIPYVSGFLFRDVRVPKGADIVSAELRLQPEGHYEGVTAQVSIAGELHGQSGDFNPSNWWAHLRPRTAARVAWNLPASAAAPVESPDIADIIEEIVALPDWKPGNNITILIDPVKGTNAWINWHAYDGNPAAAARLSLTYQP